MTSPPLFAVYDAQHYRTAQLIESALCWATHRGIPHRTVTHSDLSALDPRSTAALYVPMMFHFHEFIGVHDKIPLILDIDNGAAAFNIDALAGRRSAVRYAYHDLTNALVPYADYHTPYVQRPFELRFGAARDLIFIDLHWWEQPSVHFAMLAILTELDEEYHALCNACGTPLKFYINGAQSLDSFLHGAEQYWSHYHAANPDAKARPLLQNVRANLIPSQLALADYKLLFPRLRTFVTGHTLLTDLDVFQAVMSGAALVLLRPMHPDRRYLYHSQRESLARIDPAIAAVFDTLAARPLFHLGIPCREHLPAWRAEPLDPAPFIELHNRSWDLLWRWVSTGERNMQVHHASAPRR